MRSFGYGSTGNREFSLPEPNQARAHRARLGVTSGKALRGASVGVRRVRALLVPQLEIWFANQRESLFMKSLQQTARVGLTVLTCIFILCSVSHTAAQTNSPYARQSAPRSFLNTPMFTNLLTARVLVSNILQIPPPPQSIPALTVAAAHSRPGTYWSLQKSNQPPWPTRIFPDLPTYEVDDQSLHR